MRKTVLLTLGLVIAIGLIAISCQMPTMDAYGADGTTGTITPGNDFYYENSGVTLKLEGLTAGADYAINITAGVYEKADSNNQVTFTTGASETSKRITLDNCQAPSSGSKAVFILVYQSAGTEIDRCEVFVRDPSAGLPTALLIAIGIAVMIFALIFKIVKGMN